MNDLKFAFRQLLKNPSFSAVAILALAIGIAVTTAVFTAYNAVALRPSRRQSLAVWSTSTYRRSLRRSSVQLPWLCSLPVYTARDPVN